MKFYRSISIGKKYSTDKFFSAVIYGLFLVLMLLIISNKENFHIDEISSYGLANHHDSLFINFEDGKTYIPAGDPYLKYVTVSSDSKFDYENVWKNQSSDVHPPLYYLLLHTICSFFPGRFSKWYAGIINIIFALMTLYVLRKLINHLLGEKESICNVVSLFLILSPGILSAVSFFRMYIMSMFWVTLLTEKMVKTVNQYQIKFSFFVQLYIIAVLGALTHYYCIIFTVFICGVFFFILLLRRNWYAILKVIVTGLVSGCTAYSLFPSMLYHMFGGYRGTEAIDNLKQSPHEFWIRVKQYTAIINSELFGNQLLFILIFLMALIIMYKISNSFSPLSSCTNNSNNENTICSNKSKKLIVMYILLVLPIILYFLIVAKMSAYITDRYMFPIYAIGAVCFYCLLITLLQFLSRNNGTNILVIIAIIMIINGWKNTEWPYLYKSSSNLLEAAEKYSDINCLYIYTSESWHIQPSFMEVQKYNSVTFLQDENIESFSLDRLLHNNHLIVLLTGSQQEILRKIIEKFPQPCSYEELGSFGFATTYYFHSP